MSTTKGIKYLIVDTTGFIKNAQFQEIAENIITPPAVTKEITSRSQLRRLAVLPYDLTLKEPFPEHIKHVTEFAKKTGDYTSLSATDLQVIALTYQLEKEHVGVEHLRTEPIKKVINSTAHLLQEFKEVAGFYVPDLTKEEVDRETNSISKNIEEEGNDECEKQTDAVEEVADTICQVTISESTENDASGPNGEDWADIDDEGYEGVSEEFDDDDVGWITPSNIKEMKQKITSAVENEVSPVVACLTTDFAIQNVLKQIGLNVVALDGRVIKELRTFILRCYACFKTTSIMNKVFCPNCGNKTLKRVAVTTNPDGSQQIHINFRRPLTARGKRFSLPTPKGGKHASNPILCEDQPLPQQRATRLGHAKTNALDDDYTAGFSPFVTRDVTSRSALLGIRPNVQVKQWMRRNPNENRKPGGRKRK